MKDIIIKTFSDLEEITDCVSSSALFRGVSNVNYELKPSLFRHDNIGDVKMREAHLMWLFKTSAKAHLKNVPSSDIEWLVVAQHHGLPTRLLDWSLSPLVSLFFALSSSSDNDAGIYVLDRQDFMKEENIDVNKLSDIKAIIPSHLSPRVTAQSGMFTVHPDNKPILTGDDIMKLVIPKENKKQLMKKLVKYGVHHGTIYPSLDGISSYIKYQQGY
ncbi:hypothetical protein VCRA2114E365_50262 [Vibrio crassostreae]|uniref:FRG domain-containing protein n=1 Tax=Vibrio crassostreae TaxID=246167 RepID=UPI0006307720|nr:FRG domain-containing protein [Vibrio crassostreae]CAK2132367.1 hypothetical protein VCRA2113O357_50005 [Vibrio crassostreae]CAK2135401.1 hypothetical protein VCRA2113O363_50005 [Vibrio crassostreae]CAK2139401.1 hypothetical protein VCRA2113O359_50005 [Vibrio crassostreae]CAK2139456.1 hypothetical protein VCRA2114O367_50005 [Vibrio crassostreae]CAK2140023.1 hypothetical protein VCRA2113O354_50005 [Vibrio crassostreae]